MDNYSKPTWGLARFHFTYMWFKTLHFAHLKLVPLAFRNPPLRLPLENTFLGKNKYNKNQKVVCFNCLRTSIRT